MRVGGIVGAEVVGFTVVGVAVVGALVGAVGAAEVGVEEGTGVGLAVGVKNIDIPDQTRPRRRTDTGTETLYTNICSRGCDVLISIALVGRTEPVAVPSQQADTVRRNDASAT